MWACVHACVRACVHACMPGGEPCPAAAVAIAKAEAGETEQREFSPDWTANTQTHTVIIINNNNSVMF